MTRDPEDGSLPDTAAYKLRLARDLAAALDELARWPPPSPGAQAAADLFGLLPGYWPPDVARCLEAPGSDASACLPLLEQMRVGPAADPDAGDPVRLQLPVPHPLDADWRFASKARRVLLDAASAHGGPCVLLGTPTLFAHACGELDLREVVLVDRSGATVDAARRLAAGHDLLRVVRADLGSAAPDGFDNGTAGVVVADPPWYRPEQVGFLDAAARALRPGGELLLAASPPGSRPAAPADRQLLLHDAEASGLDLVEEQAGCLPYTSSPFEREALAAAGVAGTPTDWRRGDLLVFRRSSRPRRPPGLRGRSAQEWQEAAVARVRVRVGREEPCRAAPASVARVRPALPGGVSASVSRRSSDRIAGNIWTSGNGIWKAEGEGATAAVYGALRGTARGPDGMTGLLSAVDDENARLRSWGWA